VTDPEIVTAWAEIHDATPPGWYVGEPGYNDSYRRWEQFAYDPSERPKVGLRSREWTAVGTSELHVLREMGRRLREIGEGKVPR
jgi:hypothetical protein